MKFPFIFYKVVSLDINCKFYEIDNLFFNWWNICEIVFKYQKWRTNAGWLVILRFTACCIIRYIKFRLGIVPYLPMNYPLKLLLFFVAETACLFTDPPQYARSVLFYLQHPLSAAVLLPATKKWAFLSQTSSFLTSIFYYPYPLFLCLSRFPFSSPFDISIKHSCLPSSRQHTRIIMLWYILLTRLFRLEGITKYEMTAILFLFFCIPESYKAFMNV